VNPRSTRAIADILDTLESHYGAQQPHWPTDPFPFLVWWHCGYPPSDERCTRGWAALSREVGVTAEALLSAPASRLARILKSGGMVPELRATRVQSIASRVQQEFAGDLRSALAALPLARARALLKEFPGIADPGADRILLFAGLAAPAAVPSSCPQVPVRIAAGSEPPAYTAVYAQARRILEQQLPATPPARMRAYLLLQIHGRSLCKRTSPRCSECPVVTRCAYAARRLRPTRGRARRG
jgi:endonuclease III